MLIVMTISAENRDRPIICYAIFISGDYREQFGGEHGKTQRGDDVTIGVLWIHRLFHAIPSPRHYQLISPRRH